MIVDVALGEDDRELIDLMADYAGRRVGDVAAAADERQQLGASALTDLEQLGLLTDISEEHGGQGAPDPGVRLLLLETLATADGGLAFEAASHAAALDLVQATAARELAHELVAPFLAVGRRASLAYFEGYGRSPLELASTTDGTSLQGAKRTVVRPGDAALTVVVAGSATGPVACAFTGRPDQWRVDRDDNRTGKLGLRSAATGDVTFTELPVRVLGGGPGLHRVIAWYRLAVAAVAVGVGSASLDYAVRYAQQRVAFGREIIDFQGVEFPLVEADMALDTARLDIQDAWRSVATADDAEVIADRTARAVALATAAAVDATRTGVNTLGGHGYLQDHPQERFYRDATTLAAVDFDPLYSLGIGY